MKSNIAALVGICFFIIFSACEKPEKPLEDPNKNNITDTTGFGLVGREIFIEPDYKYQVFYNIEENTIACQNLKTDWDLAFEASNDGYHIFLNSSKAMTGVKSPNDFSSTTSYSGLTFDWDRYVYDTSKTVIGNWQGTNNTYIVDRGYNLTGGKIGYKKITFISLINGVYTFKYADLNGSNEHMFTLTKDNKYNYVFFSFDNDGKQVSIEPEKEKYDLAFTQYLHTFNDGGIETMYLVTGVLLNPYNTSAGMDPDSNFAAFTVDKIPNVTLNTKKNAIGYDWKKYDFGTSSYTIYSKYTYLIKNRNNKHFKIHFTDFYNGSGQKGNFVFQKQRLN